MHFILTRREALDVPDGINIFLFALADALQAMGHRVTMIATSAPSLEKIGEFFAPEMTPAVVSLQAEPPANRWRAALRWTTTGRRILRQLNGDFVIINGAVPLRLPGRTCTVSHDAEVRKRFDNYSRVRNAYKRWCYGTSDAIVATCTEVREALSADTGLPADRMTIVPTCVKLGTYKRKPASDRCNAILHMGTVDYKNAMGTLKAFSRVATSDRRLYITGPVTDEIRSFLSTAPEQVRSRVDLIGLIPAAQLLDLLGSVKIVSVPSKYRCAVASPTVIESLASATPVVASPSISRDVLVDGYNGYVRDPQDDKAMATAFELLLADEDVWGKVSLNALDSARAFAAEEVAKRYISLAYDTGAKEAADGRGRTVAEDRLSTEEPSS